MPFRSAKYKRAPCSVIECYTCGLSPGLWPRCRQRRDPDACPEQRRLLGGEIRGCFSSRERTRPVRSGFRDGGRPPYPFPARRERGISAFPMRAAHRFFLGASARALPTLQDFPPRRYRTLPCCVWIWRNREPKHSYWRTHRCSESSSRARPTGVSVFPTVRWGKNAYCLRARRCERGKKEEMKGGIFVK